MPGMDNVTNDALFSGLAAALLMLFALSLLGLYPFVLLRNFLPESTALLLLTAVILEVLHKHWPAAFFAGIGVILALYSVLFAGMPIAPQPRDNEPYLLFHNVEHTHAAQVSALQYGVDKQLSLIGLAETEPGPLRETVQESEYWNYLRVAPDGEGSGVAVVAREELPTYRADVTGLVSVGVRHNNRTILFIHAPSPRTYEKYRARNTILNQLHESRHDMIVGDFNATLWSPPMQEFAGSYQRAGQPFLVRGTWPASLPFGASIDQALVREPATRRIGASAHSDHRPIMIAIEAP